MNIREFIETSGVLEEYVLGTLPEQEKQGVECMARTYPEIQAELQKLEQSLEKYVFLYQKTPPKSLKENLFSQMSFADDDENADNNFEEEEEIEVSRQTKQVFPAWGVFSAAASVLLLVAAGWLFTQNNKLKETNASLASKAEIIESDNTRNANLLAAFTNPENKIITLKGLEKAKESSVTVFWNQKNNQVALRVNKLPQPASNEQYQLWTIVDGTPVDMGVLDNNFQEKLLAMKAVKGKPVAFAITLEKAGGSPTPTLDEMYVMGEV